MMHAQMIVIAVAIAYFSRIAYYWLPNSSQVMTTRWTRVLSAFVAPPLFLLMTAVAIVVMGPVSMVPVEGWVSYGVSLLFVISTLACWGYLGWGSWQLRKQLDRSPQRSISTALQTITGRVIATDVVFSAQMGIWPAELVVTQGLLDYLDEEHLDAVLAHESGHAHYKDTFWFFWLGGLRRVTGWLPHTETLWQELLFLREVRADDWAVRSVDRLTLAEALMSVITAPLPLSESLYAGFSCAAPRSRLSQRIDALLAEEATVMRPSSYFWTHHWMMIALSLSPLLTVPFHH